MATYLDYQVDLTAPDGNIAGPNDDPSRRLFLRGPSDNNEERRPIGAMSEIDSDID